MTASDDSSPPTGDTLSLPFGDVAHAFRGGLATIRNYAEILLEAPPTDEPTQQQFLRTIVGEADRLNAMLADLLVLTVTRTAAGHDVRCPLAAVVERAIGMNGALAERHGVELRVVASLANDATEVGGDPEELARALSEVVENAILVSPPEGAVELCLLDDDDQSVRIGISDGGPGVDEAVRELIFAPFFQALAMDPSRAPRGEGLGLAVARALARRNSGDIQVSVSGAGGHFAMRLRRAQPSRSS